MPSLTERYGGGAACSSGKKIYNTRGFAKRRARQIGKRMSAYKCWECGYFHLTSVDAETNRQIREQRRTR